MRNILFVLLIFYALGSCSHDPYKTANKKYKRQVKRFAKVIKKKPDVYFMDSAISQSGWTGTTNFGMRKPSYVIIHYTAQNSCEKTIQTFINESKQVSAHYIICKDGSVQHMLNDYLRAWHAGSSKWGNITDMNSASIGIELDNNGLDSFPLAQLETLKNLLERLKRNYNIPSPNFLGHSDIAPGRKIDPGILFPWNTFAESGFGRWYGDTTSLSVPETFDPVLALRVVGYDCSNPSAAIQSFRQHFLAKNSSGELSEPEKKILFALMQSSK